MHRFRIRKETAKIKAEINEIKRKTKRSRKLKRFLRLNEIDKTLARLTKKKEN